MEQGTATHRFEAWKKAGGLDREKLPPELSNDEMTSAASQGQLVIVSREVSCHAQSRGLTNLLGALLSC